jgi:hypothetical protein
VVGIKLPCVDRLPEPDVAVVVALQPPKVALEVRRKPTTLRLTGRSVSRPLPFVEVRLSSES